MKENINNFFSFPELINEIAARLVAVGVLIISIPSLVLLINGNNYAYILLSFLIYGFSARVSSGPKISPLALLVTKGIVPRLKKDEILVPGPPKRFAQGVGLFFSIFTTMFFFLGFNSIAIILLSTLILFASLEAFLGFCAGCKVFKFLMNIGLIPDNVCEKCANYQF
ncbi:MAG: DUF4395 domain-containing protein [Chloroflexota bacterium]|nr:DUF4395 domain-containing protein [Chloroflexota bacterium]